MGGAGECRDQYDSMFDNYPTDDATDIEDDDEQRQATARWNAYNAFLKQSHLDPMGEAFVAGWKAAMEYRDDNR